MSLRGVEVRRLDAHFLNLVGVGRAGDPAAEAVVLGAVDRVVVARVAAVESAPGADLAARHVRRAFHVSLEDVLHLDLGRGDAHREAREHDRHVREHRQAVDQAAIVVLAGRHGRGVEQRRLGHHGDQLLDLTDFQGDGQADGLANGQGDPRLVMGFEAFQFDANRVRARIEQDGLEVAPAVGDELLRLLRVGVRNPARPRQESLRPGPGRCR